MLAKPEGVNKNAGVIQTLTSSINNLGIDKNPTQNSPPRPQFNKLSDRTPSGRPFCTYCKRAGHFAYNCFSRQQNFREPNRNPPSSETRRPFRQQRWQPRNNTQTAPPRPTFLPRKTPDTPKNPNRINTLLIDDSKNRLIETYRAENNALREQNAKIAELYNNNFTGLDRNNLVSVVESENPQRHINREPSQKNKFGLALIKLFTRTSRFDITHHRDQLTQNV